MEMLSYSAFAAMCGVSTETLQEYEAAGLFTHVDTENGPACPVFSFYPFSFVHYLHGLGLSLEEVAAYLPGRSAHAMKALLEGLAPREGLSPTAKERVAGQLEKLEEAAGAEGNMAPRLTERPRRYILRSDGFDPFSPADGEVSARFLAGCGAAGADIYGYSGIVARADAMGDRREAACAFFTQGTADSPLPQAAALPQGPCVCAYFRGPMEEVGALYPSMETYAAKNGLALGPECYVSYVLGGMSTEDPGSYLLFAEWPLLQGSPALS